MSSNDLLPQDRYPVIVEETRRYVVWIEADNNADAVEAFNSDASDPGRDAMFAFDWDATAPTGNDWWHIEQPARDGGDWSGTAADAHVQAHRNHLAAVRQRADQAACVAAGHPVPADATGPNRWAGYCGVCGYIDPAGRTAVPA